MQYFFSVFLNGNRFDIQMELLFCDLCFQFYIDSHMFEMLTFAQYVWVEN